MKTATVVIGLFISLSVIGCSKRVGNTPNTASVVNGGSKNQTVFATPEAAAQSSLTTLKELALEGNTQAYGFLNAEDARSATLAPPERVVVIPNDKLAQLKPGGDVTPLLVDTHRLIFPVIVAGQGRTAITLQQDSDGWRLASFGQQTLAKNLVSARVASQSSSSPNSGTFELTVRSLARDYLAAHESSPSGEQALYLIPLDDPSSTVAFTGPSGRIDSKAAKSAEGAVAYSSSIYQKAQLNGTQNMAAEYNINPQVLTEKRKTASAVLSELAPAAKAVQEAGAPRL